MVRSKSEVIIANMLHERNIDYVYEKELQLGGESRYPDFTIEDDDSGLVYYWEHCGMLHDPEYRARWELKLGWYKKHGIVPHEEGGERGTLIVTRDAPAGGISSQDIVKVIEIVLR